jgi:RHS repeat-associated protein
VTDNLITFLAKTPEIFTHDAEGNLTSDGRWNFTWDGENRLVRQETLSTVPTAAKRKLEYAYDADNRRIRKQVFHWNSTAWVLQKDLRFLYDGWNLIAELDGTNTILRNFVWGLDLSRTPQGAGGVGGLLAIQEGSESHLPAFDGNGNVMALVKASDRSISARYEYGPFGETLVAEEKGISNPFRFSTKYLDHETGFYYYGFRFYDPAKGGWLSRDPIEEEGGVNLYGFVMNNALSNFDLLGKKITIYTVNPSEFEEVVALDGIEGKVEVTWNGYSRLENGITGFGWVDVEVGDKLKLKVTYLKGSEDGKAHEQRHAEIDAKWWNILAQEINWTETKWCQPCADLVVSYGTAASEYRKAQAELENSEFDKSEYRRISAAQNWIRFIDARVIERTQARDVAKGAYDNALQAFEAKCGSGTNMNK